jgi:hypothetical protein
MWRLQPVAPGAHDRRLGYLAAEDAASGSVGLAVINVEHGDPGRPADDTKVPALAPLAPLASRQLGRARLRSLPGCALSARRERVGAHAAMTVSATDRAALFSEHARRYAGLGWALVRVDGKKAGIDRLGRWFL